MAITLFERVTKERMIVVGVSDEWYTVTPWAYKGEIMPYFGSHESISDSGNVKFTYLFIGPFSVIIGKWIG